MLPYTRVTEIVNDKKAQVDRFELFARAYMHGYQDREAGQTFKQPEEIEDRLMKLFERIE